MLNASNLLKAMVVDCKPRNCYECLSVIRSLERLLSVRVELTVTEKWLITKQGIIGFYWVAIHCQEVFLTQN